jgi:hypothetical protein
MRAVEDLVNAVRDRESRRYLEEAVSAYQVGAFRSAIVATWIAVAFDLIGKIRQLDDSGDGAAADFIRGLENAINGGNAVQLQKIERDLLKVSHEKFEFIDNRELVDLDRLRDDRHICAHPAFVRPSEIFVPTPELVRAHLATAADAVLSKGPAPGKRAMQRFQAEIIQVSFPESLDELAPYLRERYFEPGKSALRRGLAELIVKGCLAAAAPDGNGLDPRIVRRSALSAHALERIQPALLSDALSAVVTKREEGPGLSVDELLCFTGNLGDMSLAWHALVGEAKEIVDRRLAELDSGQLAEVIGQSPDQRYVQAAIDALREAPGHPEAVRRMQHLVLPLSPGMTAAQVRDVLAVFQDNTQVRMALEMPPMLVTFLEQTEGVFADCYEDWYELVDWLGGTAPHRDQRNYYAYPELRERVHAPRAAGSQLSSRIRPA